MCIRDRRSREWDTGLNMTLALMGIRGRMVADVKHGWVHVEERSLVVWPKLVVTNSLVCDYLQPCTGFLKGRVACL